MLVGKAALVTCKGLFSCVIAFVSFQITSISAGIVALVTFKWLYTGVLSLVVLQSTSISAGKVAQITLKRLLSRMCRPHVFPQVAN